MCRVLHPNANAAGRRQPTQSAPPFRGRLVHADHPSGPVCAPEPLPKKRVLRAARRPRVAMGRPPKARPTRGARIVLGGAGALAQQAASNTRHPPTANSPHTPVSAPCVCDPPVAAARKRRLVTTKRPKGPPVDGEECRCECWEAIDRSINRERCGLERFGPQPMAGGRRPPRAPPLARPSNRTLRNESIPPQMNHAESSNWCVGPCVSDS